MSASPTKPEGCPMHARGSVASLEEYRAGRADGPAKCTWYPGTQQASPHAHHRPTKPKILGSILEQVGVPLEQPWRGG